MHPIIAQPGLPAHVHPDTAARQRADRLAKATVGQLESAMAFLSVIDPGAFEIAMTAVAPSADDIPEDDEPMPVCRHCGAFVGIFLNNGLSWRHYADPAVMLSGAQRPWSLA